jgi:hypothetical protein
MFKLACDSNDAEVKSRQINAEVFRIELITMIKID